MRKDRITLSMPQETVEGLRRLAAQRGTTVSALFEEFAMKVVSQERKKPLGSIIRDHARHLKISELKVD